MSLNNTSYYRNPCIEGDPVVEAIEELQEDVSELQEDVSGLDTRVTFLEDEIIRIYPTDTESEVQEKLFAAKPVKIFEPGNYTFTTAKKVNSDSVLYGYGATINFTTAGMVGFMNNTNGTIGSWNANKNIKIEGFSFKASTSLTLTMLGFIHCSDITVRDCRFSDLGAWHFIEFNACHHCTIDNCSFYNYTGSGNTEMVQIDIATTEEVFPWAGPYDNSVCEDINIINCNFKNPYDYYMARGANYTPAAIGNHNTPTVFTNNVHVSGCTFENLQTALKFVNLHNATIVGNEAYGVSNFISSATTIDQPYQLAGFNVTGNIIVGTSWDVYDSSVDTAQRAINGYFTNSAFTGNTIWSASSHGFTVRGIQNTICGNRVSNCGRNGIYLHAAQRFVVSGNQLNDNALRGVLSTDADIVIVDQDSANKSKENNIVGNITSTVTSTTSGSGNLLTANTISSTFIKDSGDSLHAHDNLITGVWTA